MLHDSFLPFPSCLDVYPVSLSSGILIRRDSVQKAKIKRESLRLGQTNQTRNLTHRRRRRLYGKRGTTDLIETV
jgi:hypothetical protein